jgi:uncharacterized membrane protein
MNSHRNELVNLIENKVVTSDNIDEAVVVADILPDTPRWLAFLNQLCLWVGSIALSLAVLFFIAFNWGAFGKFGKFILLEATLVIAVGAFLWVKKDTLLAKASITAASILVGVLLALFGQTYQTGADPWQLFLVWACFIIPWAIVARFSVLLLMSTVLINVSLLLYNSIHTNILSSILGSDVYFVWDVFVLDLFLLVAWHMAHEKLTWIKDGFSIRCVVLIVALAMNVLVNTSLTETAFTETGTVTHWSAAIWVFCLGFGYWFYRYKYVDLFILAIGCLSAIGIVTVFFIEVLMQRHDTVDLFPFLTIIVIGLGAAAVGWLKKVQKDIHNASE